MGKIEEWDVAIVHGRGELDLDGDDLAVVSDHHEVDLVVAVPGAEVSDRGFGGLGGHAHRQCGERFEEMAEHGAVLGSQRRAVAGHQRVVTGSNESGGERHRVGEVVLRGLAGAG